MIDFSCATPNLLTGHILLSSPHIEEDAYEQSVIFLFDHSDQGTQGLQLNRLLDHMTLDLEFSDNTSERETLPIYDGGPEEAERSFILHEDALSTSLEQFRVSATLDFQPSQVETFGKNILLTLGYTFWEENQLEQEISQHKWLLLKASAPYLFSVPHFEKWNQGLNILGLAPPYLSAVSGNA